MKGWRFQGFNEDVLWGESLCILTFSACQHASQNRNGGVWIVGESITRGIFSCCFASATFDGSKLSLYPVCLFYIYAKDIMRLLITLRISSHSFITISSYAPPDPSLLVLHPNHDHCPALCNQTPWITPVARRIAVVTKVLAFLWGMMPYMPLLYLSKVELCLGSTMPYTGHSVTSYHRSLQLPPQAFLLVLFLW
jgi:hypothetical protein